MTAGIYVTAGKNVSGEIIDDELIIIDLARGIYFTSKGGGLPLWRAIVAGCNVNEFAAQLAALSDAPLEFASETEAWISTLLREGIIREQDGDEQPLSVSATKIIVPSRSDPPTLEMHHDLKDILIFDPVHDFSELGWPKQLKG